MRNETQETVAAITLDQFERLCDRVDAELGEAMSGVFAQKRTGSKAAVYVATLCRDDVPVKTCWDMAQTAGLERPRPFQSLMSSNGWDSGDLWKVVAKTASSSLACPDGDPLGPGIAVDETGQPKRGRHTAGVGVQYAGFAGGEVNCVTSVTLCLITPTASTWVGNELFLQEKEWFSGQDDKGAARRRTVGVKEDLEFASKPEIARRKLAELRGWGVAFGWSAGDEVYGRSAKLRKDHEEHGEAYAYFVPRDFVVQVPSGARVRADEMLTMVQNGFEVRPCGDGLNGPRLYAWAMIATASPEHFLVIRRAVDDNGSGPVSQDEGNGPGAGGDTAVRDPRTEKLPPGTGFMYCHIPKGSPIAPTFPNLLLMIGRRWPVEETIAVGKGPIGWDHNQFRKFSSIQRHNVLSGMAILRANLIRQRVEQAGEQSGGAEPGHTDLPTRPVPAVTSVVTRRPVEEDEADECLIPLGDAATPRLADQECPQDIGCIRLSAAETLRLVSIARSQATAARKQVLLRWSMWRRRHQAIARWHHRRARLAVASPPP